MRRLLPGIVWGGAEPVLGLVPLDGEGRPRSCRWDRAAPRQARPPPPATRPPDTRFVGVLASQPAARRGSAVTEYPHSFADPSRPNSTATDFYITETAGPGVDPAHVQITPFTMNGPPQRRHQPRRGRGAHRGLDDREIHGRAPRLPHPRDPFPPARVRRHRSERAVARHHHRAVGDAQSGRHPGKTRRSRHPPRLHPRYRRQLRLSLPSPRARG